MLPNATIAHSLQGRTRFRIPSRKGDTAYFASLEAVLAANDAVSAVAANPWTGSVLLQHLGDLDQLADHALAQGLFRVQFQAASPNPALQAAADGMDRTEALLRRATQGSADIQELLFVGLLAASLIQILRGNVLGPASTLLAYAMGILMVYRAQRAQESC